MNIPRILAAVLATLFAFTTFNAHANRIRGALERFDRSTLRIRYISPPRMDGSRFAYIHDAEGFSYRVEAGDYIGKQDGLIAEIRPREIVITEIIQQGEDYIERDAVMKCAELAECDKPWPAPSPEFCQERAKLKLLPSHCAIELAKREISRQTGKLDYTRFNAVYEAAGKNWRVVGTAGRVEVTVAEDGKVLDYKTGK